MENEVWRPVVGYEGLYEVSSEGRVRSLDRICVHYSGGPQIRKGKLLTLQTDHKGYKKILLSKDGTYKLWSVHRLVALAFIPNPNNYPCVNHKDENKANNSVDNLEWCTIKYNINYGTSLERMKAKQTNGTLSKPVLQYTKDGQLIREWPSTKEIERTLGYNNTGISACCLGSKRLKSFKGYIWRYAEK